MVKSVFQIMIVALQKTLGRIRPEPFGWLYIMVFFVYFIFLCWIKPFNYSRFCLWERLSALGVIWITLCSVVYTDVGDESMNTYFAIALAVGWFLLILVGNLLQKKLYPSLLYFHKSEDIARLLRFQFRNNSETVMIAENLTKKMML